MGSGELKEEAASRGWVWELQSVHPVHAPPFVNGDPGQFFFFLLGGREVIRFLFLYLL